MWDWGNRSQERLFEDPSVGLAPLYLLQPGDKLPLPSTPCILISPTSASAFLFAYTPFFHPFHLANSYSSFKAQVKQILPVISPPCLLNKANPPFSAPNSPLHVSSEFIRQLFVEHLLYAHLYQLVAEMVKNLPAMQETRVRSLGRQEPLEKEMATHSSILSWKIPWTEEPGRLQPTGSQRVGHNWVTFTSLHLVRAQCCFRCWTWLRPSPYFWARSIHSFSHIRHWCSECL